MKKLSPLPLAAFALPLLFAFALPADEVAFHPAQDSELAKKLAIELDLKVDDFSFTFNGESMPEEAMGEVKGQGLNVKLGIGVTDKYVKTSDGRPTDLLRTFDALALDGKLGEDSHSVDEFKKLEGSTVRFLWNAEKKEYDKSFHESKGDDSDLAGWVEDMDLRLLLPEGKIAKGDSWDVPAERLLPLFMPGGLNVKIDDDDGEQAFTAFKEELGGALEQFMKEFKVTCKYNGTHEAGGVQLADIAFSYDGKGKVDLTQLAERLNKLDGDDGPPLSIEASTDVALKGSGELTWDVRAGHLNAFKMEAEIGLDLDAHATADDSGQQIELAIGAAVSGKAHWDLSLAK